MDEKSGTYVGTVIVNYNSQKFVEECLTSLRALDFEGRHEIIVVDNQSPDGSGERLRSALDGSGMELLLLKRNDGFAAGCNAGIRVLLQRGAQYIWLLNPDTEVAPEALRSLVDELERAQDCGAAGSKIYYAGSPPRIWSAGGSIDSAQMQIQMRGNGEADSPRWNAPTDCDYLPGCSMLIRAEVFRTVGLLPEEYFMYFEETDWCCRARARGFRLRYVPQSVVVHKFADEKMGTPFTVYYYNRNRYLFWSRWATKLSRLRLPLTVLFRDLPRARAALKASVTEQQRELFLAHLRSCKDYLLRRFGRQPLQSPR